MRYPASRAWLSLEFPACILLATSPYSCGERYLSITSLQLTPSRGASTLLGYGGLSFPSTFSLGYNPRSGLLSWTFGHFNMRFVAILYIIATLFLTAAVTLYLATSSTSQRIEQASHRLLSKAKDKSKADQEELFKTSLSYLLAAQVNIQYSILLAIPGIVSLFGAVSSHITLSQGRTISIKRKCADMAVITIILAILTSLATP